MEKNWKKDKMLCYENNKYILLDVLLCSITEYSNELCRIMASP